MSLLKNAIIGIIILTVGIVLGVGLNGENKSTEIQNSNVASQPNFSVASEVTTVDPKPASSYTKDPKAVCYWDWEYGTQNRIDEYYVAPSGYSYALVNLYLKNEADRTVSTNPYDWSFTADGITYTHDVATYSDQVNSQTVEVGKGGEIEVQLVYLVKGEPHEASLSYTGAFVPMKLIDVYNNTDI